MNSSGRFRCAPARAGAALAAALLASACEPAPRPPATAPAAAQRIVPASATALDFAAALVGLERIAGVPEQALEYSLVWEREAAAVARLPRFDAYLAEPVLAVRPDVVVADPWQAPDTTARLREAGVAVITLSPVATYADARANLERLGAALAREDVARARIAELDARVAALESAQGPRRSLRALAYANFGAAGSTAGAGTTIGEVFRLAGLRNAAAEAGRRGHGALSFEELIALDPDLIVTSRPLSMGEKGAGDRGGASERVLLHEPSLAGLAAVRARRVIALPARLYATGSHELVAAAEALAAEVDRLFERGAER